MTRIRLLVGLLAAATLVGVLAIGPVLGASPPARGTLDPGVKIKTHPNQPIDVVAAEVRLDGTGDGMVDGVAAGTFVDWHTHPGPTIVIVTGSTLSLYHADGCMKHEYAPGDAFVAPDGIHLARNETGADIVLRATFLLPVGAPPTVLEPAAFTACGL